MSAQEQTIPKNIQSKPIRKGAVSIWRCTRIFQRSMRVKSFHSQQSQFPILGRLITDHLFPPSQRRHQRENTRARISSHTLPSKQSLQSERMDSSHNKVTSPRYIRSGKLHRKKPSGLLLWLLPPPSFTFPSLNSRICHRGGRKYRCLEVPPYELLDQSWGLGSGLLNKTHQALTHFSGIISAHLGF